MAHKKNKKSWKATPKEANTRTGTSAKAPAAVSAPSSGAAVPRCKGTCKPLPGLAVRFDACGMPADAYDWAGPDDVILSADESYELDRIRTALTHRLSGHRLEHSFGVANTARRLALRYGINPYMAEAAGLLHDWDKCLNGAALLKKAIRCGIDSALVQNPVTRPVLHALTAAASLPELFPELPAEVFHAIGTHTSGAVQMSELDQVIFIADILEPGRSTPDVAGLRASVQTNPLEVVYRNCLAASLKYVISSGRPLYAGGIEAWNAICARLSHS